MTKKLITAAGLAAAAVLSGATAAGAATPSYPYGCPSINHITVKRADWVKVHTTPHLAAPAVGQIKKGAVFCILSEGTPYNDGHYWFNGYGYNEGVKLTGWVVSDYF